MTSRTIAGRSSPESDLGQVYVTITVENGFSASRGPSGSNVIELKDILMDSGATLLCLPADVIASLGLAFGEEVPVAIPTGFSTLRIFLGALVRYEDRIAEGQCLELPVGSAPLLGAVTMEMLGIEPNLRDRVVRKLGVEPGRPYLHA